MRYRGIAVFVASVLTLLASAATAAADPSASAAGAKDYTGYARNIVPSGEWGSVPVPPAADTEAKMYDGLTPLFDQVSNSDLNTYYKSEKFGVGRRSVHDRARPACRRHDHARRLPRAAHLRQDHF